MAQSNPNIEQKFLEREAERRRQSEQFDAADEEIRREFRPGLSMSLQTQRVRDNIEVATGLRRSLTNPGFFFAPTATALTLEARREGRGRTLISSLSTGTKLSGRRIRLTRAIGQSSFVTGEDDAAQRALNEERARLNRGGPVDPRGSRDIDISSFGF